MKYHPKNPVSPHAKRRFSQRYEGDVSNVEHLANGARHKGIRISQIPSANPLKDYMLSKSRGKEIVLYEGYVFVFSKSKRLITMYRLKEEYAEAYALLAPIEEKNKAKWRLHRKR